MFWDKEKPKCDCGKSIEELEKTWRNHESRLAKLEIDTEMLRNSVLRKIQKLNGGKPLAEEPEKAEQKDLYNGMLISELK